MNGGPSQFYRVQIAVWGENKQQRIERQIAKLDQMLAEWRASK
jgi:hypothetical protein